MKSLFRNLSLRFLIGVTFLPCLAHSAPVMDTAIGTPNALMATVLPDHLDANLFYVFPQESKISRDASGDQEFLYIENRRYGWGNYRVEAAYLSVGVLPSIQSPALEEKMSIISAANPNAKFAVVTVFESTVIARNEAEDYFESVSCPAVNGPIEIPVYCDIRVKPELVKGFRKAMAETNVRVFFLVYKFYGFANGQMKEFSYTVPIKVGNFGKSGAFFDQNGKKI